MFRMAEIVAQICNLLYRRFAICGASRNPWHMRVFVALADCKSAIRQITNLRYDSGHPETVSCIPASSRRVTEIETAAARLYFEPGLRAAAPASKVSVGWLI